jgi:glycosyltransferase involved in cell wall biosynthesis
MRLVTITHCFPARGGGIELVANELIEQFERLGLDVEWFSSNTAPAPQMSPGRRAIAVPTWNIVESWTRLPYPLWSPGIIPQLWSAIGRAQLVHVHEHMYMGSVLATAIARLRRRPVIITQHAGAADLGNRALTLFYRCVTRLLGSLMFPAAAQVVFISTNVRLFFGQQSNARARLIFNGLDSKRFVPATAPERQARRARLGLSPQRPAILFVGRFLRKKGLDLIQTLAPQFPQADWLLVGSGPEDPSAWREPNVRVVGRLPQHELPAHYQACDLLILPSRGEGFPLVVQEALACGLGVLSTDEVAAACPPAERLIRCVPLSEHTTERWHAALSALLADIEYLDARSFRSQQAGDLWSWRRCAAEYLELFEVVRA